MMILDFLPQSVKDCINKLDFSKIYDIRLRAGFPIKINYGNEKVFLSKNGKSRIVSDAVICSDNYISEIINKVTENSLYAFNNQIVEGYLTTPYGVRIGLAGQCVFEKGKILTVKNITSLNIRIPHEIANCSCEVYKILTEGKVFNTLIVSPPERGKTTILKDLARKLNARTDLSIMIIDERGEFESVKGSNIDSIKFSDKLYAFNYGLRSLSPNIVITDELAEKDDWVCVKRAGNSGVKVVASCHAENIDDLAEKDYFQSGVFERIIILDSEGEMGRVKAVFNENLEKL